VSVVSTQPRTHTPEAQSIEIAVPGHRGADSHDGSGAPDRGWTRGHHNALSHEVSLRSTKTKKSVDTHIELTCAKQEVEVAGERILCARYEVNESLGGMAAVSDTFLSPRVCFVSVVGFV
jgi:hypothetical protein